MPRALHAVASRYERADGASPRRRTGEPHADILRFAAIVGFCCFRRRRAGRRGAKRGQAVCEITGLRFAAEVAGVETFRGAECPATRARSENAPWRRCPVARVRSGSPAVCGATGQRFVAEARDGDALWRRMSRGAGAKWRCPVAEMSREAGTQRFAGPWGCDSRRGRGMGAVLAPESTACVLRVRDETALGGLPGAGSGRYSLISPIARAAWPASTGSTSRATKFSVCSAARPV